MPDTKTVRFLPRRVSWSGLLDYSPASGGIEIFWHPIRVGGPLHHTHPTYEYEHPFRYGTGHIFRIPFTRRGVTIGRWIGSLPEDVAAFKAAQAHTVPADIKGEGGESVEEHRERRFKDALTDLGWTVL